MTRVALKDPPISSGFFQEDPGTVRMAYNHLFHASLELAEIYGKPAMLSENAQQPDEPYFFTLFFSNRHMIIFSISTRIKTLKVKPIKRIQSPAGIAAVPNNFCKSGK